MFVVSETGNSKEKRPHMVKDFLFHDNIVEIQVCTQKRDGSSKPHEKVYCDQSTATIAKPFSIIVHT